MPHDILSRYSDDDKLISHKAKELDAPRDLARLCRSDTSMDARAPYSVVIALPIGLDRLMLSRMRWSGSVRL